MNQIHTAIFRKDSDPTAGRNPGSSHPVGSASGVEAETWHEWLKKHHETIDLNKAEDMGMFLAFALVEIRLRKIGQYTGDSPTPNNQASLTQLAAPRGEGGHRCLTVGVSDPAQKTHELQPRRDGRVRSNPLLGRPV